MTLSVWKTLGKHICSSFIHRDKELWPLAPLTCVYPQVDLEVVGGAEGLATVGAVLGGLAHAALSVLGQRQGCTPGRLHHLLSYAHIWSTHTRTRTHARTHTHTHTQTHTCTQKDKGERQMKVLLSVTSNHNIRT